LVAAVVADDRLVPALAASRLLRQLLCIVMFAIAGPWVLAIVAASSAVRKTADVRCRVPAVAPIYAIAIGVTFAYVRARPSARGCAGSITSVVVMVPTLLLQTGTRAGSKMARDAYAFTTQAFAQIVARVA